MTMTTGYAQAPQHAAPAPRVITPQHSPFAAPSLAAPRAEASAPRRHDVTTIALAAGAAASLGVALLGSVVIAIAL